MVDGMIVIMLIAIVISFYVSCKMYKRYKKALRIQSKIINSCAYRLKKCDIKDFDCKNHINECQKRLQKQHAQHEQQIAQHKQQIAQYEQQHAQHKQQIAQYEQQYAQHKQQIAQHAQQQQEIVQHAQQLQHELEQRKDWKGIASSVLGQVSQMAASPSLMGKWTMTKGPSNDVYTVDQSNMIMDKNGQPVVSILDKNISIVNPNEIAWTVNGATMLFTRSH